MKADGGKGGTAQLVLNFYTKFRYVV